MSSSPIGQPITRVDGKLKVTGRAPYAVEHAIPNLTHGVAVASTIGNGRIKELSTAEAEKMPGVLAILHHGNIQNLYRPAGTLEEMSRPGESRPPFEDDIIYYYGQYVALVVAETFEQAQDAAAHNANFLRVVADKGQLATPAGFDLLLAGHTHGGQFLPWTWLTSRIYGQYVHGLKRFGKLMIFTTWGAGTWGPPLRVGTKPEIVLIKFE